MKKRALITGITGQDGSYLAEFLLKKGYEVHGMVRRVASEDKTHRFWRLRKFLGKLHIHAGSLESYASMIKIITKVKPHELYHLGAQSYIDYAFKDEFSTLNTNINGTHYLLSAIKEFSPKTRFYFAGTSEMFGKVRETPQSEKTPFYPRSVYGISKVAGFDLTRNYREAYNLFCCSGILFNHESPRRGSNFVTNKVVKTAVEIKKGLKDKLELGNMDSYRDWGHSKDYVRAMHMIINHDSPDDFVVSTGETNSVREMTDYVFSKLGMDYKGYVVQNPKYIRPEELKYLKGDCTKLKSTFNWEPEYDFEALMDDMIDFWMKTI